MNPPIHREGPRFIVIPVDQRTIQVPHNMDTFVRIGVDPDDVPQPDIVRRPVRFSVRENGLQRFEIGVDISKNSESH